MKINASVKFETFRDGMCDIYTARDSTEASWKGLHFQERTVGAKRFTEFRQQDIEISRLIRIHALRDISMHNTAVIDGITYDIEQVQHIKDTNPPVTDLTLRCLGMFTEDKDAEMQTG